MNSARRVLPRSLMVVAAIFLIYLGVQLTTEDAVAQSGRSRELSALDQGLEAGMPPKSFMRRKLDSTQKVMEGLTTENLRLVVQGSEELLKLTDDASWKTPRDAYYIHYSNDFKRTLRDLHGAAKRGNVEEATFAYTHATFSCMACHRHVRGVVPVSTQ